MQKRKPNTCLKPCPKPSSAPPTIAQRAKLSSRPTTAPSTTGSSTGSGSQHSTDAGFVHDNGAAKPASSEAVTYVSELLVQGVLDQVMGDVTEIVARTHSHSLAPRPALNQARKEEMRSKSFTPTINSLQRAYSKLLHENFEDQWSSEIAGNVRDLAAAIVWKLGVKDLKAAEEGREVVIEMLEHQQVEFKWEKNLTTLKSAVDIARIERENAYKRLKTSQYDMKKMKTNNEA